MDSLTSLLVKLDLNEKDISTLNNCCENITNVIKRSGDIINVDEIVDGLDMLSIQETHITKIKNSLRDVALALIKKSQRRDVYNIYFNNDIRYTEAY
jgi:hypothetical protein